MFWVSLVSFLVIIACQGNFSVVPRSQSFLVLILILFSSALRGYEDTPSSGVMHD